VVTTRCLGCGGTIELEPYTVPDGVMARGDRFMHVGCVFDSEATSRPYRRPGVAYFIPRGW